MPPSKRRWALFQLGFSGEPSPVDPDFRTAGTWPSGNSDRPQALRMPSRRIFSNSVERDT